MRRRGGVDASRKALKFEVEGQRMRRRPRGTWMEQVVQEGVSVEDAPCSSQCLAVLITFPLA